MAAFRYPPSFGISVNYIDTDVSRRRRPSCCAVLPPFRNILSSTSAGLRVNATQADIRSYTGAM